METGLFPNSANRTSGAVYNSKKISYGGNAGETSEKSMDSFEKAVNDQFSEREYKDYQESLRRRKQEIKQEQQQAFQLSIERRRKLKLLLKKHEDYVRFLEGTALKKSLAERERIQNPEASEAEINSSLPMSTFDAKMPLFIRVR